MPPAFKIQKKKRMGAEAPDKMEGITNDSVEQNKETLWGIRVWKIFPINIQ